MPRVRDAAEIGPVPTDSSCAEVPPAPPDDRGPPASPPQGSAAANFVLLTIFVLIAGFTPAAAKDALDELPPLTAGFARFAIASLLLTLTRALRGDRSAAEKTPIAPRDYATFAFAAFLCVPVNQACYLTGVQLSSTSHAGLFYAMNPVLTYLLTLLLGRAVLGLRLATAALLAFAGAAVIAWESLAAAQSRQMFAGDVLLFFAVLSWAMFTLAIVPLSTKYGSLRSVTIVMLLGAVMYSPVVLVDGQRFIVTALSARALAGFLFITVLTSYVNYLLWSIAIARIDVNRIAVSVNASPIVAVIAGYFWRHEPMTRWLGLGAALILLGITLANWERVLALAGRRRVGVRAVPTAASGFAQPRR